jgi:flavin reductase (DIM6/NTAB) family NADH-FMN oxidoreductase RutF
LIGLGEDKWKVETMKRDRILPAALAARPVDLWNTQWLLLSAGDFAARKFNSMTVSWGSLGVLWNKPIAMCVVRPQRRTRKFMDDYETFTLCAFGEEHRRVLDVLGSKSGRDMDKVNQSGFTAEAATTVAAPVYAEAALAIECRKIYFGELDPKHFLADYIKPMYNSDYHRMYLGEIVAITGTEAYRAGTP